MSYGNRSNSGENQGESFVDLSNNASITETGKKMILSSIKA